MKKLLAAVTLMGAGSLALACSVDATGTGEEEFVGESQEAISQWACTDKNGIIQNLKYQYEAQLAVATLAEMGDAELDLNYRLENGTWGKLMLTQTGLDKCAARGKAGCPSVSFLLALQSLNATQAGIPGWSPDGFRNILESHFKRYLDLNTKWTWSGCVDMNNTCNNTADDKIRRLSVAQAGTSNDGVCAQYGVKDSLNYWYSSSQPNLLWCKFAGFGGPYNGNYNCSTNTQTPASGEGENPFMKYVTRNGGLQEGIDPVGGDMNGRPLQPVAGQGCGNTASTVGAFPYLAPTGVTVYQSEWINACCYVNGKNGVYQKHPMPAFSNTHVYCKTP